MGGAYYCVYMSITLTVRTDESLRKALEERARAQGKTLSEFVREVLREAVDDRPLAARTGHLRGRLTLDRQDADAWREELRRRNWRQ